MQKRLAAPVIALVAALVLALASSGSQAATAMWIGSAKGAGPWSGTAGATSVVGTINVDIGCVFLCVGSVDYTAKDGTGAVVTSQTKGLFLGAAAQSDATTMQFQGFVLAILNSDPWLSMNAVGITVHSDGALELYGDTQGCANAGTCTPIAQGTLDNGAVFALSNASPIVTTTTTTTTTTTAPTP